MMRGLFGVLLAIVSAIGWAQSYRAEGSTVIVNGESVFTLRSPNGRYSPAERAAQVVEYLRASGPNPTVSVRKDSGGVRLVSGSRLIVRITTEEARAQSSTPDALASQWAQRLNAALALPPVLLERTELRLPPGGTAAIPMKGSEVGQVATRSSNPQVARAELTPQGWRASGVAQGSAILEFVSPNGTAQLRVDVLPYAANLGAALRAAVVGVPAQTDTVRDAAIGAVYSGLPRVPGSSLSIKSVDAGPLGGGQMRTARVRVEVSAPNAFTTEGIVNVAVTNLGESPSTEGALWYSNKPESVTNPMRLFAAVLGPEDPSRLLYHHINVSGTPLVMHVAIQNLSDQPAVLAVTPGDGVPNKDPVRVGLEAGRLFMQSWLTGSGQVVEIPPRSILPIAVRRLAVGETMSGLCTLRLIRGEAGNVIVRTDALNPADVDPAWRAAANSNVPYNLVAARPLRGDEMSRPRLSDEVYPSPFKSIDANYEVGGAFAFVRVGQEAIASQDRSKALQGNFGVVYNVEAEMSNPTQRAAEVEVVFEASAGYGAAVIVVNGELAHTPLLQSKQEFLIRRVRLAPGQRHRLSILTVPLSGSSYPVTLTIRPRDLAAMGG